MAVQLLPGIAVGYACLVAFVGVLARFYIFTRANWRVAMVAAPPGQFVIRAEPEAFLHMATHSFVLMIATGAIVTAAFSGVDWSSTAYVREYGMNNLFVFFDLPPASYVIPPYWLIIAFCILRYCVLDTERLLRVKTSEWCKYLGIAKNGIFAIVAIVFNLVWSVGIETDVVAHELPFLMLIMCIPLAYVMHVWEMSYVERPACLTIVILSIYVHVSVFYALGLVALRFNNMNPDYAKPLQWLWVGLSSLCPPATFPRSFWSLDGCRCCCKSKVQPAVPIEPRDPDDDPEASMLTPVKIQVRPRVDTPEDSPSFTTAASQSTALTSESQDQLAAAKAVEVQQSSARSAGAPLRFAMGLSPAGKEPAAWEKRQHPTSEAEAEAQPASASLAEARSLGGSRVLSEAPPPTSPNTSMAPPPTSPNTSMAPSAMVSTLRSQGLAAMKNTQQSMRSQVQVEAGSPGEERTPAEAADAVATQVISAAVRDDAAAEAAGASAQADTAGGICSQVSPEGSATLAGAAPEAVGSEAQRIKSGSTNPFEEEV